MDRKIIKNCMVGTVIGVVIGLCGLGVSYSPIFYLNNVDPSMIVLVTILIALGSSLYAFIAKRQSAIAVGIILGLLLSVGVFMALAWGA
jgi:hypothetical protein